MNGPHDMGGLHGFGDIDRAQDDELFHAEWERRVLALALACGATGEWNLDESRFSRESLPRVLYLNSSYYRIWFEGLQRILVKKGFLTEAEIAAGKVLQPPRDVKVLQASDVVLALQSGSPVERQAVSEPVFKVADQVLVRNHQPVTHTRLPAYIRAQQGVVAEVHGCHIYPDSHASGQGEDPRWLYSVEFAAADLWGDPDNRSMVMVDCWEPYLQPVDENLSHRASTT